MLDTLWGSTANSVIILNTLRKRLSVMSCQLARLRLFPTAQVIKIKLLADGRKETDVSPVQNSNAPSPTYNKLSGSVREVRPAMI